MTPDHAFVAVPFAPRRVFLFSGHLVDAPDRPQPRFPAAKVQAAQRRIAALLEGLSAGPRDLGLSQATAGGDLLFLQAALDRGVYCEVLLPFDEPEFLRRLVEPAADDAQWRERYRALRKRLPRPPRLMPRELGPLAEGMEAFARCNLWLLRTALACGPDKVHFVCLWNGSGGDGPGGMAHLLDQVRAHSGHVHWLDTHTLDEA